MVLLKTYAELFLIFLSLCWGLCWREVPAVKTWEKVSQGTTRLNLNQWAASEDSTEMCWQRVKSFSQSSIREYANAPHLVSQNSINSLSRLNSSHLLERH